MNVPPHNSFETLSTKLGRKFESIRAARKETAAVIEQLRAVINGLIPPDTSFVVFGSLARQEWTSGSDVDWTLLVDGQADPEHRRIARKIDARICGAGFKPPGPTGTFGNLSFSHGLIHRIGGEHDTNENMTRRILLLLESVSMSRVDAHLRLVRGVLNRYLESERSFLTETGRKYKVPRFLLNDIVRYWRTVAVDYVNKQWERGDDGWALRNVKLRFSRKLLFVSGLLICLSCYLNHELHETLFQSQEDAAQAVLRHLSTQIQACPLDILCAVLEHHAKPDTSIMLLEEYDRFLAAMNNKDVRNELKGMKPENAAASAAFDALRKASQRFQEGLNRLLYKDSAALAELMLKYGVF